MTRIKVSDVKTALAASIHTDVKAAVGANTLLSLAEQQRAPEAVKAAAVELRQAGGPHARVTADGLEKNILDKALQLIGSVNQGSGSGAAFLSKKEAQAAQQKHPQLGQLVMRAFEVASSKGVDVDAIALARVRPDPVDDVAFKTFATMDEAMHYADPDGRQVAWLVEESASADKKVYLSGRNDLWAQRFEVDRKTGAITVTAEH